MSYAARVLGEIAITPPLKTKEYANTSLHEVGLNYDRNLKLHVVEYRETDGTGDALFRRHVVGLIPMTDESFGFWDVEKEVHEFARQFAGGHSFSGHLMRIGEEQGDVTRYSITDDGQVIVDRARLVWEDGSDVEGAEL